MSAPLASGVVLALLAAICNAQAVPAYPGRQFICSTSPFTLAAGDINGDAALDTLRANPLSLPALLGDGGGRLGAPNYSYSGAIYPLACRLGDLDGDGVLDATVIDNIFSALEAHHGNNNGYFNVLATYTTGFAPQDAALGDLDNDGDLDCATCEYVGTVTLLLGDGLGGFAPAASFPSGAATCSTLAFGEFNSDGNVDVAITSGVEVISMLGTGLGTLGVGFIAATFGTHSPLGIALGDMNGDGNVDFITSGYGVGIALGDGIGGATSSAELFPQPVASSLRACAAGDIDGDTFTDIVTTDVYDLSLAFILYGDGAGGINSITPHAGGDVAYTLALSDMNTDGRLDIIVSNGSVATLLLSDGLGHVGPYSNLVPGIVASALTLADFNGDQIPDAAVVAGTAVGGGLGITLAFGDGLGAVASISSHPTSAPCVRIGSVDLNNDAAQDLVVVEPFAGLERLLGDGSGGFGTAANYTVGAFPFDFVAADLDLDGDADLSVVNANSDSVSVLLNDSTGNFAPEVSYSVLAGSVSTSLAGGDLNGDNVSDLVVGNLYLNDLVLLLGDGAGGYLPVATFAVGAGQTDLELADLDVDGDLDISLCSTVLSGNPAFLQTTLGDGAAHFAQMNLVGPSSGRIAARDVNGDGVPDLLTSQLTAVAIHMGAGLGDYSAPSRFAAGAGVSDLALADLDLDGDMDIAIANSVDGLTTLLHPGTAASVAGLSNYGTGTPGGIGAMTISADSTPHIGNAAFALTCSDVALVNNPTGFDLTGVYIVTDVADVSGTDVFSIGLTVHVGIFTATELFALDGVSYTSLGIGHGFAPAPIPFSPALIGKTYFAQAVWLTTTALAVASSDGLSITIQP